MANKADIANTIANLKAVYSNYTPNDFTSEVMLQVLSGVDSRLLAAALMQCLSEPRQFAPSPGEILHAANLLRARAAGIPPALTAYDEVCNMPEKMERRKLVREGDQNIIEIHKLKFSHPAVEKIARKIGWPEHFPSDNPSADRAQFMRIYEAEVARVIGETFAPKAVTEYLAASKSNQLLTSGDDNDKRTDRTADADGAQLHERDSMAGIGQLLRGMRDGK